MTYEEYVEKVKSGCRFRVDFLKRKFYLNKKEVEVTADACINLYEKIEELYKNYKYSYPSEKSSHFRKSYFKALNMDEMTDAQLVTGEERTTARCKLEAFILTQILNGNLKWNFGNYWFWQSKKDSDLVIFKEWVV